MNMKEKVLYLRVAKIVALILCVLLTAHVGRWFEPTIMAIQPLPLPAVQAIAHFFPFVLIAIAIAFFIISKYSLSYILTGVALIFITISIILIPNFIASIDKFATLRMAFYWLLAIEMGWIIACHLETPDLLLGILVGFQILLVISVFAELFFCKGGCSTIGPGKFWAGILSHKQDFGWCCADTILVTLMSRKVISIYVWIFLLIIDLILLKLSFSAIGLYAAILGSAWIMLTISARKYVKNKNLSVILLFAATVSIGVLVYFCWPLVLGFSANTPTLDGRWPVWRMYMNLEKGLTLVGEGLGVYSGTPANSVMVFHNRHVYDAATLQSMHLTALLETGWIGLISEISLLLGIACIVPIWFRGRAAILAAALAVHLIAGGIIEPYDASHPTSQYHTSFVMITLVFAAILAKRPLRRRGRQNTV